MSCQEFERALDRVFATSVGTGGTSGFAGSENPQLWRSLERHAAACDACSELLELARLPQANAIDIAGPVLARTAGGACLQVEESLNEFVCDYSRSARSFALAHLSEEQKSPGLVSSRDLIVLHLDHCRGCAGLAAELELLYADLPRLAQVQPEASLVAAVLRRTLPWPVRARRWWAATWPRWVLRPRFAVEFAFAVTLVLVVIFATPGSPLQAMPERAFDLVRADSFGRLETWPEKAQGEIASKLRSTGAEGKRRAFDLMASVQTQLGTISNEVASWFVTAEDEPPAQDPTTKE